jgi:transcriptional/translational regulatory protein YebC/TACO1
LSGHSKWSTIKRQKAVKDAARGAVFTKLGNAIAIAARSGTDPETNFSLRLAIDQAKAANMPSANIQRSIDRVKDKDAAQLQEVLYEGYGPGGVAVLVETATDNINRTYPDVKPWKQALKTFRKKIASRLFTQSRLIWLRCAML